MFKLPSGTPSASDSIEVLTDYLEYQCIMNKEISLLSEIRKLLLCNDEIDIEGIEDESDKALNRLEEVTQEIQLRIQNSLYKYPFSLYNKGYNLRTNRYSVSYWVYLYLLFSTRLNMKANKVQNGIDGTKILEKISAEIAKTYFGPRAESFVFGTAEDGRFETKINELCQKIGEGVSFYKKDKLPITSKDDKLDVVVWVNFQDGKRSKIIGFGQCKTGTSFDDRSTIELQPEDFCKKWFLVIPVHTPVKMFFCSQPYPLDDYSKTVNGGIIFDRIRIMDFLPYKIDSDLFNEIIMWCIGTLDFLKLQSAE